MDYLPDHIIVMILSRVNDSADLARCRCVSKSLNTLGREVPAIHLYCSLDRYTKMRSREARSKITPLKNILYKLISDAQAPIESVSVGIDESLSDFYDYDFEFEEECDDLFLTAGPFCVDWLTRIGNGLKSISISNFSTLSYQETNTLEVISSNCHGLVELTLKEAVLCVDNMHPMLLLTKLTLNNVAIYDRHLNKLMECLPCLQVFNWIDVRDNQPKIHHLNLEELKWTMFDCHEEPTSLSSLTIYAPKLTKLKLESGHLMTLNIHAPLLSYFDLALEAAYALNVDKFKTLKTLRFESFALQDILKDFPVSETVQNLTLDLSEFDPLPHDERIDISIVFTIFPNVTSLTLGSEVCSQLMLYSLEPLSSVALSLRARLKQITVYLVPGDIDKTLTFILYVKGICSKLTDIVLFFHCDVDSSVASSFVSLCTSLCPKVRFRWGHWNKEDGCISKSMVGATYTV